ncbi:hypothetical protein B0H19DRAFT_392354 [Mycena capillaripes]|nr:hypothetical protein B0H19DRAFT_392354 [Mycena capillaripes]
MTTQKCSGVVVILIGLIRRTATVGELSDKRPAFMGNQRGDMISKRAPKRYQDCWRSSGKLTFEGMFKRFVPSWFMRILAWAAVSEIGTLAHSLAERPNTELYCHIRRLGRRSLDFLFGQ